MQKILIDEDQVTTLKELAKSLAKSFGWKSHRVEDDVIYFKTDDGKQRRVDTSGFAQVLEGDEWVDDDELNVDWDEEFDGWSNHVWAEDENGNTVMLHD